MAFVIGPSRNPIVQAAFAGLHKEQRAASKAKAKPEVARPKEAVVHYEPYRRLVASMPCKNCNVQGFSQAAHPPPTGKGIKSDDRECFPLCTTRAGKKGAIEGCHPKFDLYKLMPHDKAVKQAKQWAAETRAEIEEADLWPKKLAKWKEPRK